MLLPGGVGGAGDKGRSSPLRRYTVMTPASHRPVRNAPMERELCPLSRQPGSGEVGAGPHERRERTAAIDDVECHLERPGRPAAHEERLLMGTIWKRLRHVACRAVWPVRDVDDGVAGSAKLQR